MKLTELLGVLDVVQIQGDTALSISGVAYDSRRTYPGNIFVAIRGLVHNGASFIPEAYHHGVRVVVTDTDLEVPAGITKVTVPSARAALAELANYFFDFPSRKFKLVGITGTKGKTTVSYLIEAIFKHAGFKTGVIGTVESRIEDEIIPARLTTPESLDLQWLLSRMTEKGITHGVMEVTSHALALGRVEGVAFDRAIFTNISYDHIDFHGTKDEYVAAKLKLFQMLDESGKDGTKAIINIDDYYAKEFIKGRKVPVITYGMDRKGAEVSVSDIYNIGLAQEIFTLDIAGHTLKIKTGLIGKFNVSNILAAVACGYSLGIDLPVIKAAVESVKGIPGRFEIIDEGQQFLAVVDFAHTPDSLEKLLETVRTYTKGKLMLVFGCHGDNDTMKREMMGSIARGLADFTFITTDNPKEEDPEKIMGEIELGMVRCGAVEGKDYLRIEGRKTAIKKALEMARDGDAVVVAGRGHEPYQNFKGVKIELDDREVVRDGLRAKVRV